MSNETKNRPVETIRDGAISASIWKNEGQNGSFYSVTYERVYTDEESGQAKNARDFSGSEILRQQRLAGKAYDAIEARRAADREQAKEAA